jgi:SAM-dependent methyltransferase
VVDDSRVSERALSFGPAASAYERFRPAYPDRLIDEVLAYAGTPIRTALEIGAGTGKATRAFAARGIAVTATEPDAAMLAELRKHVPSTVSTLQHAFEDLPLTDTYDLVFAAAAMHWTQPHDRWSRVAALLTEYGVFASFGGPVHLEDPAIGEALRAVRSEYVPDDRVPSPDGTPDDSEMQWPATELNRSEQFTDVRQITIERRIAMSARDYIGHLSTISAYLQLPAAVRAHVFDRILTVLPARVTLNADLVLHLARATSTGTYVGDADSR